ncbi:MAG: filamentous hemagglutinin N-terminal domain-containing protein [Phormidesmis sp.]
MNAFFRTDWALSKSISVWKIYSSKLAGALLTALLAVQPASVRPASAQVASDASFQTLVNGSISDSCTTGVCTVTGGLQNNANSVLFHSFSQFSLPDAADGPSVLFIDPGVDDIVARVTGGDLSIINSTIFTSADSTANLFLINPSGIQFGPSGQLDLGGGFVGSTASEIFFDSQTRLPSGTPSTPDSALLTVSAPVGLGLLADSTAPVQIRGTGHALTFSSAVGPAPIIDRSRQQPSLTDVPAENISYSAVTARPEQTFTLVANGIEFIGGNVVVPAGQIELGSVAQGSVSFNADGLLDYSQVEEFADITLAGRSSLDVSATTPGHIIIQGDDLFATENTALLAETLPPEGLSAPTVAGELPAPTAIPAAPTAARPVAPTAPAPPAASGSINLNAAGDLAISDFETTESLTGEPNFTTYIGADVGRNATGTGSNITLRSENMTLDRGAQIGTNVFGNGTGGNINITVRDTALITDIGPLGMSSLLSSVDPLGTGDTGRISLNAGQLTVEEGALIRTANFTQGVAGAIALNADQINLRDTNNPPSTAQPNEAPQQIVPPARIDSITTGRTGEQGEPLSVNAQQFNVTGGAQLVTVTLGEGTAGDVNITAEEARLSGVSFSPSDISNSGPSLIATVVSPEATGDSGDLTVNARRLSVVDGGQIGTATLGSGNTGNLTVSSKTIDIAGLSFGGRSGLFSTALNGTGSGGSLVINTDSLNIRDGGAVSASNFNSLRRSFLPPGQGSTSNLDINASIIRLNNNSLISADTVTGDRGNITLNTNLLSLRNGSRVTTDATGEATGGNIQINAPDGFVVAVPEENSDITANAVFGDGGSVSISAQAVIGIEQNASPTGASDITASSDFGADGETRLNTLNPEIRQEASALPQSLAMPAVAQGCKASISGRFVQTGRGGVSTTPYGILNSRSSLADVSLPTTLNTDAAAETAASQGTLHLPEPAASPTANNVPVDNVPTDNVPTDNAPATPEQEAQAWAFNRNGEVVLLAETIATTENERCLDWRS